LTETFAGAAFSEWDDYSVGRVGPPLPCCYIKVCHISLQPKNQWNELPNTIHSYILHCSIVMAINSYGLMLVGDKTY